MKRMPLLAALVALACAGPATAERGFDYWVLALSWSPEYCESGRRLDEPQCQRPYHFVVHGLWPQYERGYPRACRKVDPVPTTLVERMLPLMPSTRLVQHQWRQHGSCSGMEVTEYFLQTERARRRIAIPLDYVDLERPLRTDVGEVEHRFIQVNPGLRADSIAVTCAGRWLREVRICLDKDFRFRACGSDVHDRCRQDVQLRPSRPGRR